MSNVYEDDVPDAPDEERRCVNCGEILPPLHWWQRNWLLEPPPFHKGKDGEECWRGFMRPD
jgi:hypothetical protein